MVEQLLTMTVLDEANEYDCTRAAVRDTAPSIS